MHCDLKLSGGTLVDGSGAPARRADVAVTGGRVAAVGDLRALEAAAAIDCTGRLVAPGFIDVHSHADWLLPDAEHGSLVEPFVRQGMTTVVAGNCGFSPAPVSTRSREAARGASRLLHDGSLDPAWETSAAFLGALEASGVSLNVAQLVGHGAVHAYSGDRGEEDALRAVLAHPRCTIETDTILTRDGHQNPASFGTFPRVLATYVREGLFPLEEAVRKMTGAAAERLGLRDRGLVRAGAAADLVVFDPARLADRASFEAPTLPPEGIDDVLVNGRPVLRAGVYDPAARAGPVLRG
jgi:N-acyl-D-aspartate/D-glutamate deacylase